VEKVPARHALHVVDEIAPDEVENFPAMQDKQDDKLETPEALEYVPETHNWQLDARVNPDALE